LSSAQRHITCISSDAPVEIRIDDSDGTWFRVLNWLIDSGVWSTLQRSEMAVLGVLLRHRNQDGLVLGLSIDTIARLAGLKRSQAYASLAALATHPAGLLAHDKRRSFFEPLPGRCWASRRSGAPRGLHGPPVQRAGLLSDGAESCPTGRTASRAPSELVLNSCPTERKTAAAAEAREISKDAEAAAAAAALLVREGLPEAEARRLAATAGYTTVRRIIANADALAARGRLRNRRSYIALGVRDEYSLFEGAERDAARVLRRKAAGNVTPEIRERLQERRIAGAEGLLKSGLVNVHEVADLDGPAICNLIATRLEGGAS
jgi:hypothetical protein